MKINRILSTVFVLAMAFALTLACAVSAAAEDSSSAPTITVETVEALAGSTVEVDVKIENNPGILGLTLTLSYDEGITLTSATVGDAFEALSYTPGGELGNGWKFVFDGTSISPEDVKDGVILTLTFEVSADAEPNTAVSISVSYEQSDIIDNDMLPVNPAVVPGGVKIIDYIPGDVNSDGDVNTSDVVALRRYIAGGYGVTINEPAGDVNGDSDVNTSDVVALRRYIAGGYGVVLLPSPLNPSHTHTPAEAVVENEIPATCTTDGSYDSVVYCTECGEEISRETIIVPALGHDFYTNIYTATCNSSGYSQDVCSVCSEVRIETTTPTIEGRPITDENGKYDIQAPTDHEYDPNQMVITTPPTCTSTGIMLAYCPYCDFRFTVPIPELGHDYVDGACTRCGEDDESFGFTFELLEDDTYSLTDYTGSASEIVIPSTYNGKAVTSIGDYAFWSFSNLTSIEIPDGVISIGDGAFWECRSLTNIKIPDSVTSIGDGAFEDCTRLTSVEIPDSVTSIDRSAFSGCSSLISIEIPDSVTSIGDGAFEYCSSLTLLEFGENSQLTSIGYEAFSDCTSLTSIEIPDSVTSIGNWAFRECTSLTSVKIPDNVTIIAMEAFRNCSNLTSVTIGDSVTSIDYEAFSGCSNLTSIEIPDSVTSIDDFAFDGCSSLKDVYYTGSEAEWSAISIGSYNESLTNATIHYNYGSEHVHTPGERVIENNVEPTCTTDGSYDSVIYCTECDEEISRETIIVTTPGHDFVFIEQGDPTCTTDGYTLHRCSVCGEEIFEPISATGHTPGKLIPEEAPTCVEHGKKAFYPCNSCDAYLWLQEGSADTYYEVYVNDLEIAPLGHTAGEAVIENEISATCTTDGSYDEVVYCTGCGEELSRESFTIDATGHNYENGTCTGCGDVDLTYGFSFTLSGSTYKVTGYTGSATNIVIPSTYNGKAVTSIGNSAFENRSSLTSITIPTSITSFGNNAFKGCSALDDVYYLGTLEEWCGISLTNASSIPTYNGSNLYIEGELLTELVIPYGVTDISNRFRGCSSITSVEIPSSVSVIGSSAFTNCANLAEVKIPESVTSIGSSAFHDCVSLASITIPSSVTSIGESAFRYCISLTSITIPENVTSIGNYAFRLCTGLKSIVIPDSVASIGTQAFDRCDVLSDVYYTGSEAEWSAISIGTTNEPLTNATIHYNCVLDGDHLHVPTGAVRENENPATCTAAGSYESVVYCSECGEEISRKLMIIPTVDHNPGEAVHEDEIPRTCTTDGGYDEVVYCTKCGEEISREVIIIPAAGHTPGEAVHENETHTTCTTAGIYDSVVYCSDCGEEISRETVSAPALKHDFVNDVCDRCGYELPSEFDDDDCIADGWLEV